MNSLLVVLYPLLLICWLELVPAASFVVFSVSNAERRSCDSRIFSSTVESSPRGFGKDAVKEKETDLSRLAPTAVKEKLLDLLPRMTGQEEEYRWVERYVNVLEERYQPAQTLQFMNMALQGDWQLLFSTNLAGTPNPMKFRLRELVQTIECSKLEGIVTTQALWDLAEDADGNFDATGTFLSKCSYEINQGARMIMDLDEHILQPARGSKIPSNFQGLVGLLHRSMPKELFDPSEHAMDTTYLDADLRIVRYTGPRFEGTRDIFIRASALEIDPTAKNETQD